MKASSPDFVAAPDLVLVCSMVGTVLKVLHDDLGLGTPLAVGQPLGCIAGDGEGEQASELAQFVQNLSSTGFAFVPNLHVGAGGSTATFSLTGGVAGDAALIVGHRVRPAPLPLVLEPASPPVAGQDDGISESDAELLSELSRANHAVVTAQREILRRNTALTQANKALEQTRAALEAKQAELLEANVQLTALATTDSLTGIKNRRAFEERLTDELARYARYRTPLSLLLLDVDRFKEYNDTFGHQAGDDVLKAVADSLKEQARATDFVARYGGEEFVALLPNTGASGAVVMAERLRSVFEASTWPKRAVTASFGIATLAPEINTTTELVEAADRALYASKEQGRNRVTHVHDLSPASGASPSSTPA